MDMLRQGDGVLARCQDGIKRFGTIEGGYTKTGQWYYGVAFADGTHQFLSDDKVERLYSVPSDFGVLYDNDLYHYPNNVSKHNWQLEVRHSNPN